MLDNAGQYAEEHAATQNAANYNERRRALILGGASAVEGTRIARAVELILVGTIDVTTGIVQKSAAVRALPFHSRRTADVVEPPATRTPACRKEDVPSW